MLTIIHGDNQVKSRKKLWELILQAQSKGFAVTLIEAKNLHLAQLETSLASTQLFNPKKLIVIHELHSLKRSKQKGNLIEFVAHFCQKRIKQKKTSTQLILWEKRALTKTMAKKFPQAQIFEFKLANSLFKWLDSFSPNQNTKGKQLKLLQNAIQDNDEFACLAMLSRQIRLLIQAKEQAKIKAPPFVISKLKRQADQFTLNQLIKLHAQLLATDLALKTSTNQLELDQKLAWLVINC